MSTDKCSKEALVFFEQVLFPHWKRVREEEALGALKSHLTKEES